MKKLNIYLSLIIISLFVVSNNVFGNKGIDNTCEDEEIELQFVAGIGYASHHGSGSYSSPDTSGLEEPFEVNSREVAYNVGLGFYDQPVFNLPTSGLPILKWLGGSNTCVQFSANVTYGSSLDIDEARLEATQTDDVRYAVGISISPTLKSFKPSWLKKMKD